MKLSHNNIACKKLNIIFYAAVVLYHFSISSVNAEEISAFKLLDYSGVLSLRSLAEDYTIYSDNNIIQLSDRDVWQQEVALSTRSYIYHPNFLKVDLGAGIIYDQTDYSSLTESNEIDEVLENISARLDFLSKRPYPVTLSFSKETPIVSTGLSGSYIQENKKSGINISLLRPFSPVQFVLSAYEQSSYGENAVQIVNEEIKQIKIDADYSYGRSDSIHLTHQNYERISGTGSKYLPIEISDIAVTSSSLNTKNIFGLNRIFTLVNNVDVSERTGSYIREDVSWISNLRWKHSIGLHSFYRIESDDIEEQGIIVENKKVKTGLVYSDNSFSTSFSPYFHDNYSSNFEYIDKGANYNIVDKIETNHGEYRLSYNASYNVRDQMSDNGLVSIYGDEYIVEGVTQVEIEREYIDIATISVSNISRTQTYVEGLDYNITVIGSNTYINRIVAGNIADGESVLIDYSYQSGGTYKYSHLTQNFNINLALSKYYNLYIRWYDSDKDLDSGIPAVSLNPYKGTVLGLRVDRPLASEVTIGGEVYAETRDEEVNPYDKRNMDMYIDFPLPARTNLRLNTHRLRIDNESTDEDVDLSSYILRIQSKPWLRVRMSYESSYEKDTGGNENRVSKNNRLKLNWSYRQLSFDVEAKQQIEEQGITERDRLSINMMLKRVF